MLELTSGEGLNAIVGVNNRALVVEIGDQNQFLAIDRSGTETVVPNVGNPLPIANTPTDRNGFCAVEFDPSIGVVTAIVRYSY